MAFSFRRMILATALAAAAAGTALAAGGDLIVFDWSGYEDPLLHADYTAKQGAEPSFSFFAI